MSTVKINNNEYILADSFLNTIYSKGCRTTRDMIKQKNISQQNYIFGRFTKSKNTWTISDGKATAVDKVLLLKSFVDENITKKPAGGNGSVLEEAPAIIQLDDNEKFKDNDGNVLEIETRGEREHDKIYFRVKDVSEGFKIKELRHTIVDERSTYEKSLHYVFFACNVGIIPPVNTIEKKQQNIKEMYVTYNGILKILFTARTGCAEKFMGWATKTLFTVQMGTVTQKEELIGSILGTSARVVKEVFSRDANKLPCIYFFTLGLVKDLRKSMSIDNKYADNALVGKFGFSGDLSRRTTEHMNSFSKINGCNLKLKYYSYVDPQYMSKAENDIKCCVKALNISMIYENQEELIVVSKEHQQLIENQYEHISKKYMGHNAELITQIKELKEQLEKQELIHQLEIQKMAMEIESLKSSKLLLEKDLLIATLQQKINVNNNVNNNTFNDGSDVSIIQPKKKKMIKK